MCETGRNKASNNNNEKTFEINTAKKKVFNLESGKTKPYDMDLMIKSSGQNPDNNKNGNG